MTETTRVFSISLPVDVAEQVERTAAAEGRSISEMLEESFRACCVAEVRKIANEIQAEFQRAGITGTEEDVEQWVEEVRAAKSKH